MKENDNLKSIPALFGRYLYDRRMPLFFYILTIGIFLVVLNLNRLDYFSEIFYGVILSGFLILVYGIKDLSRNLKENSRLYFVLKNPQDIYGRLPESRSLQSEMYSEIIWNMDEMRRKLLSVQYEQEKERKDYYSMWVHQIKTPLQAARLLLERDEMKGLAAAKGLEEEIFKTEQYVEMVLQYLRCQSMGEDLILKEYDLASIIKKVIRKYALFFINSRLTMNFDEMDVSVLTDEKWLGFVLEQLLSIAVKYTKQGGISIYLDKSCTEYQGQDIAACLVIEDTGIGIREEDLPRIFEKGFTGFNGRMDRKSTGIGLYLCMEILKKLAVPVRVASKTGEGTKVYLYFRKERSLTKV